MFFGAFLTKKWSYENNKFLILQLYWCRKQKNGQKQPKMTENSADKGADMK